MLIQPLPWDSAFFSLKAGKIAEDTFNSEHFLAEKHAFDVIYIFERPDSDKNEEIRRFCPAPADTKVTFIKEVQENIPLDEHIRLYEKNTVDETLLSLCLQSGIYSRFKTDAGFPSDAYERLYKKWIENSVEHGAALAVLTYQSGDSMAGFITLEAKDGDAHIGLFAVDEQFRGMGIGKKLLAAAEHFACLHHFKRLLVSTQQINQGANETYRKYGFSVHQIVHKYHYWNR